MTEPHSHPPRSLLQKVGQFAEDAGGVILFALACAFLFVTGWLMLDFRNSWLFGWLPF